MNKYFQRVKDFFTNLVKRFRKPAVVVQPTQATPVPALPAPATGTIDNPIVITHTSDNFGYSSAEVVRLSPRGYRLDVKGNEIIPDMTDYTANKISADPTKTWFGTEFGVALNYPVTASSVAFTADGKYEVVLGYDVDRGNITASIPGIGAIHQGNQIDLRGVYNVVLSATGPGGSSVYLNKIG